MNLGVSYIIYLALCAITGIALQESKVELKKIEYWIILGCVIGAYICGRST